jgi:hypothetical protein
MVRDAWRRAGDEVIAAQIGVNTNRDRFLANGGMHHFADVACSGQRPRFRRRECARSTDDGRASGLSQNFVSTAS